MHAKGDLLEGMIRHRRQLSEPQEDCVPSSTWPTGSVRDRVAFALEEVRPALRADGGDVELIDIDGCEVRVHLKGACKGCPMAGSTLADFVTERIKLYAPEIERIIAE